MIDKSRIYTVIPNIPVHQYVFESMKTYGNRICFVSNQDCYVSLFICHVSLFLHVHNHKSIQLRGPIVLVDNTANIRLTSKDILEGAQRLATSLYRHGVRKGDIVGIISETHAHYCLVSLGVMACGAIVCPCNPRYTKAEMKHQLYHSSAKIVICSKVCMSVFTQIIHDLPDCQQVFTMQRIPVCVYECLEDLVRAGSLNEYPLPVTFDPANDTALLPYSSGTTGLSKGVVLTHRNLLAVLQLFNSGKVLPNDVGYGVPPSFHIYGFSMQMNNLIVGAKMVTDARFDLKTMLEIIQREKVTYLLLVPPIMVMIAKSPEVAKYDVSSVRKILCGAAPLATSLASEVTNKMKNAYVTQGWGLTECCPVTTSHLLGNPVASTGTVSRNTEIRIVDIDTGKDLGVGENGELLARGPQVMKEYFKNPEATRRAIDKDGWFHTGDIGHVDKHGFYYIVDRLKELIKYKGFQVAPAELEALLLHHPQIADVAVIGVPDLESGELPKAFVVRKSPNLTEKDVQNFVKDKVSKYKELKGGVTFIDAIPKSQSGKILRRHLRNKFTANL